MESWEDGTGELIPQLRSKEWRYFWFTRFSHTLQKNRLCHFPQIKWVWISLRFSLTGNAHVGYGFTVCGQFKVTLFNTENFGFNFNLFLNFGMMYSWPFFLCVRFSGDSKRQFHFAKIYVIRCLQLRKKVFLGCRKKMCATVGHATAEPANLQNMT